MIGAPTRTAALSYGGLVLRFVADDPDLTLDVRDPHGRFLVSERAPADCTIRCTLGDPTPSASPIVHGAGTAWELRIGPTGEQEVTFFGSQRTGRVAWMTLRCSPSLERVDAIYRPYGGQTASLRLGFPLDEYLMARLLGQRGGLVMHAASALEGDRAILLVGHSGAGKSTLAELAESVGAQILSDDRTIITFDKAPTCWGTPWHGTYRRGAPESARIAAILLLVQAPQNRVVPLSPARAFQELFVRLIQPTVEPSEIEAAADSTLSLVNQVHVAELHFRAERDAYDLARAYAIPAGSDALDWGSGGVKIA